MQNKWSKCIGVNNWHLHQILEYERDLAHFIGFGESLVLKRLKLERVQKPYTDYYYIIRIQVTR